MVAAHFSRTLAQADSHKHMPKNDDCVMTRVVTTECRATTVGQNLLRPHSSRHVLSLRPQPRRPRS